MKAETKYKGSIKLSAIGDALGWITEFEKSPNSIKTKFGVERVEQFVDWEKNVGGRFYGFVDNIKAGSYSDDTQLMLAVARSIREGGDVDHDYFAKIELPNWLYYARGGGRTVKNAAEKITRKSVKWNSNFYTFKINGEAINYRESGANGAAMRVLPIALANFGNIEKIKQEIFCNSIVTHGHPRAILGAMLFGYAINQALIYRPDDFTWENYITQLGQDLLSKLSIDFKFRKEVIQWLEDWNKGASVKFEDSFHDTLIECQNQLRTIYQSLKRQLSVKETLKKIGCFDPSTKGSGVATVIAGIYLFSKFNARPQQSIIEAVNLIGADTDSIAAFTGSLVGALHGQNIIPDKWKAIQDLKYLDSIADKMLEISEDRYEQEARYHKSNLKSINNLTTDDLLVDADIDFFPLGKGKVNFIDRQPTLTKGKYNLIAGIQLEIGQSIIVSKLFEGFLNKNDTGFVDKKIEVISTSENLMQLSTLNNKDVTLPITLFHGTSTLFLDSIIKNGLGGIDPIKEWKLLELSKEVYELSERYLKESDLFMISGMSFQKMTEQSKVGSFNWQHGNTYLSPAKATAARYAINKPYGSELLTYTLNFLKELVKLKLEYVNKELFRKYANVFGLIEANPSPLLIQVTGVPKTALVDEMGEDPESNFKEVEETLHLSPDLRETYLQQCNFRLLKPVSVSNLKFWLINVQRWHPIEPIYNLYQILPMAD